MLKKHLVIPILAFVALSACSSTPAHKPTPLPAMNGDNCLTGNWTLESSTSQLTLKSTTIPVSGLRGAILRISSAGTEIINYDTSAPALGNDGAKSVSETLRGTINFRLHAASGTLTLSPLAGRLTATINDGTTTATTTLPPALAQTYTYTCSPTTLKWSTTNSTYTFSRLK